MPTYDLWLEFEVWRTEGSTDDPSDEFFNMTISLPDGNQYALNVWTYGFFNRAVAEAKKEDRCSSGSYLMPPDLFVEKMDRKEIEAIVEDLIECNGLRHEWLVENESG